MLIAILHLVHDTVRAGYAFINEKKMFDSRQTITSLAMSLGGQRGERKSCHVKLYFLYVVSDERQLNRKWHHRHL